MAISFALSMNISTEKQVQPTEFYSQVPTWNKLCLVLQIANNHSPQLSLLNKELLLPFLSVSVNKFAKTLKKNHLTEWEQLPKVHLVLHFGKPECLVNPFQKLVSKQMTLKFALLCPLTYRLNFSEYSHVVKGSIYCGFYKKHLKNESSSVILS